MEEITDNLLGKRVGVIDIWEKVGKGDAVNKIGIINGGKE